MDQEMIAPELPFEDEQDDSIAAQNLEEFRENEHPISIEPPPIPLAHRLLIGPPYETLDLLLQDLNHWAKDNGLGFIKRRVSNYIDSMPPGPTLNAIVGPAHVRLWDSTTGAWKQTLIGQML